MGYNQQSSLIGPFDKMNKWLTPRKKHVPLHAKIKFLLDFQYEKERELLLQWLEDFTSPDGEKKAIDQFQATFHSVFLEAYLNKLLGLSGAQIDTSQTAPDFKVQTPELTYFVEATVANFANDINLEHKRTEKDIYGKNDHYEILDESITRILNRLRAKSADFKGYTEEAKTSPFVIAVGDFSQINYGQASYYAPLAVLYNAYYDPEEKTGLKILCEDSFDREYKYRERHGGKNQDKFELGFFASEKYKHISAVIYTCTLSLGKLTSLLPEHGIMDKYVCIEREVLRIIRKSGSSPDESLGDGVFVFHNPFAEHPLDDSFLNMRGVSHVRYREDDGLIDITCNETSPLVRRFAGPLELAPIQVPDFDEFCWFRVASRRGSTD